MLYGTAYYHEYQPYERLEEDIRLMTEAGLTMIRVGESTWSKWEPEEGRFEFEWLERVIDAAHHAGLKVILGTPTYAIPAWLSRKHPEIMAQHAKGQPVYFGGRQNMDFTHPAYLFYAERVIRQAVGHFAGHPAIVGYQLDNETGSGLIYNQNVFNRFVDYLKQTYGSVERLNELWGLTYWSHNLADWADLWRPDGNTTPGYDLAWRRFQSKLVADFLAWQAQIVREYARPDQFITHDTPGGHSKPETDRWLLAQSLDIQGENPYHPTQDWLNLPQTRLTERGGEGVWSFWLMGDLARSAKQSNFLILETNGTSIENPWFNYPAYEGQWRLAAYAFIARGANSIAYWHWHTLHYGAENYIGGVLNHALEGDRFYQEVTRIGHELRQHGDLLTDLQVEAEVGFLYSRDSRYAFDFQPPLSVAGGLDPDPESYKRIFDTFYRAFFETEAQTGIVHVTQEFEKFPLLVVPALYIADEELLARLTEYARQGGHILLTFRSGYADEHARIRWQRAPGPLREAVGASYQEFSNLLTPLTLRAGDDPDFKLPAEALAQAWADGLLTEGATALAYYDHPHFGRYPAITSQPFGKGRVTYCGTLPNPALGQTLAEWVMNQAGLQKRLPNLPPSVRVSSARTKQGDQRLWFVSNWSWQSATVSELPMRGKELFSGARVEPGGSLELGQWDIKLILEDGTA